MKKVLTVLSALLLTFVLFACVPAVETVDGSLAKLDTAHGNMSTLIGDPSNITASFQVPTALAGGVTATWESSNVGVVSFGTPSNGISNVTVNRPAVGQGDAVVTITATLTLKSELSDEMLTKEWSIQITVKENTVVEITIDTIADILAIVDPAYDGVDYAVSIENVTVFVNGGIPFGYDGTGIIQLFQAGSGIEVGKVYNIEGTLEWFYGIWEIVGAIGTEVTNATPQMPTKEVVTSVDALLGELIADGAHAYANVADGNFEPIYATVTGKIYMIPGDSGNYNTFIIDSEAEAFVPGTATVPANGLLLYYQTNDLEYVRSYNGFEVSLDVVIYTYRSNNLAFAVFYTGGPTGITATLTDAEAVTVTLKGLSLPADVTVEDTVLSLPTTGANGTTIAWSYKVAENPDNDKINLTTGAVTLPAVGTQVSVVLVATATKGAETSTKEFTVKLGELPLSTIAEVKTAAAGKFRIQGVVLGYNGNNQISVADATGAITVYGTSSATILKELVGRNVEIIGAYGTYQGLVQLSGTIEVKDLSAGTLPTPTNLSTIALWDVASLLPYQAGLVSAANLKVTAVGVNTNGNVDLTLLDELTGNTIKFFWDSKQPLDSSTFILTLAVGDYVSFNGAVLSWKSNLPTLAINAGAQAVEGVKPVLTDANKLNLDKNALTLSASTNADLTLPLGPLANGTTVTWETSDAAIISAAGVFTAPTVDTDVTLTATLTNGTATDTKVFVVNALAPEVVVPGSTTVTAAYSGGTTTNMVAGNNAATIGLNAELFTVTSIERGGTPLHVGLNKTGQIRLYGNADTNGNTLTIEIAVGYKISKVEIVFGASDTNGLATISFDAATAQAIASVTSVTQTYNDLNATSFSIKDVSAASSDNQVWILSIAITYSAVTPE